MPLCICCTLEQGDDIRRVHAVVVRRARRGRARARGGARGPRACARGGAGGRAAAAASASGTGALRAAPGLQVSHHHVRIIHNIT